MAFCQRVFNWVFQPPPELRQGGIPSRGRKQGCFQPGPPDSATMRQARRSSSAMLAKYTAWVTAPGRRACENEVKRTAGGQGRKTAAQPADHRRVGIRPPVPHRGGVALRGLQPALRAGLNPGDHQPALRRVDRGVRVGEADRGTAGPPHPPRPHPGNERRQLPAQA